MEWVSSYSEKREEDECLAVARRDVSVDRSEGRAAGPSAGGDDEEGMMAGRYEGGEEMADGRS